MHTNVTKQELNEDGKTPTPLALSKKQLNSNRGKYYY